MNVNLTMSKSKIYSVCKENFEKIVKESETYSEILRKMNYKTVGSNLKVLKMRITEENIDTSHLKGYSWSKGKTFEGIPHKTDEEVFIKESKVRSGGQALKKRLLKRNLVEEKCAICLIDPVWNNIPLTLQLDHINGDCFDNRIENLRLLCPNCHSQTDTFCTRNKNNKRSRYDLFHITTRKEIERPPKEPKTKRQRIIRECLNCGKELGRNKTKTGLCQTCIPISKRKVERPTKEQLLKEIMELGYCGTGRKYGVSDNSIRKWLKS